MNRLWLLFFSELLEVGSIGRICFMEVHKQFVFGFESVRSMSGSVDIVTNCGWLYAGFWRSKAQDVAQKAERHPRPIQSPAATRSALFLVGCVRLGFLLRTGSDGAVLNIHFVYGLLVRPSATCCTRIRLACVRRGGWVDHSSTSTLRSS